MGAAQEQVTEVAGYRLAERIGSGGMGEVYKAYNASLDRYAAVKILHQAAFADRFKNEAYIQSSVNHHNIAKLYEYTSSGDKHCIVMEYAEGECLDQLLQRKGRLSSEETENIIRQIASALAYLHQKDIMHRDIKPQNFKVQTNGFVKMLDFGIAKHKYSPKLTQVGFVVGTMEYLAPEQFQQEPELKSDTWALAVMTYELLTGYMPFESSNPATLQSKVKKGSFTDPKILIPGISEKLLAIIDRGLKVNPVNRISAAGIESILGKKKQPGSIGPRVSLKIPPAKILWSAGALIALLLIIFLLINKTESTVDPQEQLQLEGNTNEKNSTVLTTQPASKVMINTPGINNAELILDDGARKALPYAVEGKEGDRFQFTIHADGYRDKKVEVQLTPQRSSFEYNLEKINN
ncbi:hypothetical protein BH11BAC4_BH11BAC4_01630 [soil metagenome]